MTLTDKQQIFCEEYLIDLNATQAAIRAGYSEKTARQIASDNLTKANIQDCIASLKAERSDNTKTDAAWVLLKARECFEACVASTDYSTAKGYLDIAGKHVSVKAFDTSVKHEGTIGIEAYELSETERSARIAALLDLGRSRRDGEVDND